MPGSLATASKLEGSIPWGIVQQLFGPLVVTLDARERELALAGAAGPAAALFGAVPDAEADTPAMTNAIYWLASNLSEEGSLALFVDDAQWADAASLGALVHLARRIEELPVALIVCSRLEELGAEIDELALLSASERTNEKLALAPLSPEGVEQVLKDGLSRAPGGEAITACHRVTGGNPYLLRALVHTLGERIASDQGAEAVRELGPEALARATAMRLRRHPKDERAVAAAVSVLGPRCELRHVAALAGLEVDAAAAAADALAASGLIEPGFPLRFVHPTITESVSAELPAGELSSMHARAAQVLAADSDRTDAAAAHLLQTEPAGDPDRVGLLSEAALQAERRGAPAAAAEFLRRALHEPPDAGSRATVLRGLGRAETRAGIGEGIEHLRAALELADGAYERSRAGMQLGRALAQLGRVEEAQRVFEGARKELGEEEPDYAVQLAVGGLLAGMVARRRAPELAAELERVGGEAELPVEQALVALGTLAWSEAMAGESAETTHELALRSFAGGITPRVLDGALFLSITALISTDSYEDAERLILEAMDVARSSGATHPYSMSCAVATYLYFRSGRLADAVATGENAIDIDRHAGLPWGMPVAPGWLVHAYVERGELDLAKRVLALHDLDALGPNPAYDILRHGRGALREAEGDLEGALTDFIGAGEGQSALGAINPSLLPWRSSSALAAERLGDSERAGKLAAEEVALAERFGAPRALGVALRAHGVVVGGEHGVELLRRSVEVLEGMEVPVEHARALVELGSVLRRAGLEREARDPLREGLHLATAAQAAPLAEHARDELVASGARPRRAALAGPGSLTPSEQRVARLAADGRTNREIAQKLFLSVKTIEFHLRNGFRKLDIDSREQLPEVLEQRT